MTTPFQPNPDPDWLARYLTIRRRLRTAMQACVVIAVFLLLGAIIVGPDSTPDRDATITIVDGQRRLIRDKSNAKQIPYLFLGLLTTSKTLITLTVIASLLLGLKYNRCPMCGKHPGRYFPTDKIHCPHCGRTLPENAQG